jgi:hypothetical protein
MRFERCAFVSALASVSMVLASPGASRAAIEVLPQSGEFQVNTYTPLNQSNAAIATDSQGNFVVVWEQLDGMAMPQPDSIVARRFSSTGTGLGPDFQVNVFTTGVQRLPWVARSAAGGFVVVWTSYLQDGDMDGVFGRRYDAAGNALAAEFQISTHTTAAQSAPKVAMGSGGDFVVVWNSSGQDGEGFGVFGRRFDSAGAPLGAEFPVNTHTAGDQALPNVARKGDGSFIVTWTSNGQDGDSYGAFGRRFASDGSPLTGEFQLNAYTIGKQSLATVAHAEGDAFVAAWQSEGQDGSGFGIFANGFDSSGVSDSDEGEIQINEFTTGTQIWPVVLAVGSRHFVVVWSGGSAQDGSSYGVFARGFDMNDQSTGEFLVNTTTISAQLNARAATTGQRFVVVWQSGGQDGSFNAVIGRRFVVPLTLDVDGDGLIQPLTDGLLTMRYEFGFHGNTLITGAVGPGCTRCDAPSIEAYLAQV